MGTKEKPANFNCYANALPDEPMFILLARDPSAPLLVDQWAEERAAAIKHGNRPESDTAMVAEAQMCARNMREWRRTNNGKWRKPMTDWQDISTAPKDGTWLLVFESFGVNTKWSSCDVARWRKHQWEDSNSYGVSPTHWMPLPDPPIG